MFAPTQLRVEHLDEPLGITVRQPRLSWRLPPETCHQVAYRIRAGEWDSHRVESDQSLLVPYAGPALMSGERVSWTVKVWTDAGESDWSQSGWWEMGLLDPAEWTARWVEPVEGDDAPKRSPRPAYLLRNSFTVNSGIAQARLYASAHGIYEPFLNGQRVGDMELAPGYTSYPSVLHVQTFDVTELLVPGDNVLGAILSDGWYRGQTGSFRVDRLYGDTVAFLAQLHIHYNDGTVRRVGTGPSWTFTTGPIVSADLMVGQTVDLRREIDSWATPGAEMADWGPVTVCDHDTSRLRSSPAPPVRRTAELRPVAMTHPEQNRYVVDFGQNINGWVRLTKLGQAGAKVTLSHGEALDADGAVTVSNVALQGEELDAVLSALELPWDPTNFKAPLQVDQAISAGRPTDVFEPCHTTHGFRFVQVDGHPGGLSTDDLTGVVVHTDMPRTGWFTCSDDRLNRLHEAAAWSFRSNACDIPTDCPTRERAGWTGDWQIFVSTAAFLYDVAGFSEKWLTDLAAEQRPDGSVLNCVPNPLPSYQDGSLGPFPSGGAAGWADAAVIVPWEIYRAYGDRDLLERQWHSMTAWIEYATQAARKARHPGRADVRPTPAAHERYLWDTGLHFGEWLEPGPPPDLRSPDTLTNADHGDVATAYLHYSSRLLAEIARILGRSHGERRYRHLASATREAWQAEYIRDDGMLIPDKQATYVRALAFDLIPTELRPLVADRLVALIRKANTHLGTGFLATPYLLPVLADTGHLDVAYELLFQDTEPSWLTMIDRGATTVWEQWDAIDERGRARGSLNHYAKGAVVSFLHRHIAGIRLLDDAPAYRHFRVEPMPGGGLTWARAAHNSPYGHIESSWRIEDHHFFLDVAVPPGTSAQVCLPDGHQMHADPGTMSYRCSIHPETT